MILSSFKKLYRNKRNLENIRIFQTNFQRFSAKVFDGKLMSREIHREIKQQLDKLCENNIGPPKLVVIQAGEDPASEIYLKIKLKTAEYLRITTDLIKFEGNVCEKDLVSSIENLNTDDSVNGILVQLPLPVHIDERLICNLIDPKKDVDGFHYENAGKTFLNMDNCIKSCTPIAVIEILKRSNIKTNGKLAVVCGNSKHVGLPIALMLQADRKQTEWGLNATVTMCNSFTPRVKLEELCRAADIIVSATGVPNLITPDIVKPGACVIDVGITRIENPDGVIKTVGDVDFEGVSQVAGFITPVPGGVGPMTVAMLMRNVVSTIQNR